MHHLTSAIGHGERIVPTTGFAELGDDRNTGAAASRQPPGVGEAVVAQLAENYMIKKLDSEYSACLADSLGQLNIVLAG